MDWSQNDVPTAVIDCECPVLSFRAATARILNSPYCGSDISLAAKEVVNRQPLLDLNTATEQRRTQGWGKIEFLWVSEALHCGAVDVSCRADASRAWRAQRK